MRAALGVLVPPDLIQEKRMFGSVAFMVDGKLCVTVKDGRLMCRVGPDAHDAAVAHPGCEPMVMRGRALRGYVRVSASSLRSAAACERWVRLAVAYNPMAARRNA